jgi:multidrug resistance efflux pump
MQRIKKRPRLDTLVSQQRSGSPVSWSRRVYLGLIGVFGFILLDYAAGDAVILRAHGIVLTDRAMIAATYSAKIAAVRVREGESVEAGQVLVELESAEMLRDIADLAARNADLAMRETQLRVKRATLASLLPLAERHAGESLQQIQRIDTMANGGLIPASRLDQALLSRYESAAKLAELRGQEETLSGELSHIERAHRRASDALSQLETFYDQGLVRAAAGGVVGAKVPMPGQVVKFGEELLQVNGQRAYVLAYLPELYLFAVKPGDRVDVTGGSGNSAVAELDAILTVADALPAEFQNMFRPRDRSRLVRLSLPADTPFAVSQKVRVRGCALGWCWRGRRGV